MLALMNTSNEEGTSLTIDAKGNIVPKPYGVSRWANPRRYECSHDDCDEQSIRVSTDGCVHNCCGDWHHWEES